MPPTIQLCKSEEAWQEKVPIAMNNLLIIYWQSSSNLQHKEIC